MELHPLLRHLLVHGFRKIQVLQDTSTGSAIRVLQSGFHEYGFRDFGVRGNGFCRQGASRLQDPLYKLAWYGFRGTGPSMARIVTQRNFTIKEKYLG